MVKSNSGVEKWITELLIYSIRIKEKCNKKKKKLDTLPPFVIVPAALGIEIALYTQETSSNIMWNKHQWHPPISIWAVDAHAPGSSKLPSKSNTRLTGSGSFKVYVKSKYIFLVLERVWKNVSPFTVLSGKTIDGWR